MGSKRHGLFTHLTVLLGNVLVMSTGLITGVLSARWLGPVSRGEYAASFTWAAFLAVVVGFGIPQSIVIDKGSLSRLGRTLIVHLLGSMVLALSVGLLLSFTYQPWLSPIGVVGFTLTVVGSAAGGIAAGLAQRTGRLRGYFQAARVLPPVTVVGGMIFLIISDSDSVNMWLLVVGVALSISGVGLLALGMPRVGAVHKPWYEASFIKLSAGMYLVALPTNALYRADSLMLGLFAGSNTVAYYAVAAAAMGAVASLSQVAGMISFSRLRTTPTVRVPVELSRSCIATVGVSGLIAVPVIVLMSPLVRNLFGDEFLPAVVPSQILVLAAIPMSVDYVLSHALLHIGGLVVLRWIRCASLIVALPITAWISANGSLNAMAISVLLMFTLSAGSLIAAVVALHRRHARNIHSLDIRPVQESGNA